MRLKHSQRNRIGKRITCRHCKKRQTNTFRCRKCGGRP